ncbi:MAG: hypothetical protein ACI4T8_01870 [Christensenellales bacterium]
MDIKLKAETRLTGEDNENRIPYTHSTKFNEEYNTYLAGLMGGTCYMKDTFDTLLNQEPQKHLSRGEMVATSGHHSCFGHSHLTLEISGVPKIFAMILNNESEYNTSEKSGRYTIIKDPNDTENLYDKWLNIFTTEIRSKYKQDDYFTDIKVKKLAQENARYLNSIFLPCTSLVYTTSYRQINYLCKWMDDQIQRPQNIIYEKLKNYFGFFIQFAKDNGLYKENLANDNKSRNFSLFNNSFIKKIYDYSYQTYYKCTFVALADMQRHRSLDYFIDNKSIKNFTSGKKQEFYIPKILNGNEKLKQEWLKDIKKKSINDIPQGALIKVCETGSLTNFILKTKERLCSAVQLEVLHCVKNVTNEYAKELERLKNMSTRKCEQTYYNKLLNTISPFTKGSRCLAGYKCKTPCKFLEGINCTRKI